MLHVDMWVVLSRSALDASRCVCVCVRVRVCVCVCDYVPCAGVVLWSGLSETGLVHW